MEQTSALAQKQQKLAENLNVEFNKIGASADLNSFLHLILATAFALFLIYLINLALERLDRLSHDTKKNRIQAIKFRGIQVISKANLDSILDSLLSILRLITYLLLGYGYLTYSFGIFPATRGIAAKLLGYLMHLTSQFGSSLIHFIPNLITIAFIAIVTYYTLKIVRFFSRSYYFRQVIFPGFKHEWIAPTYDIAKFFIIAFAVVMIFPYLPGSDSAAFKGVSVFLGIVFTLGSGTAISNLIAGLVLIYMSPFTVGDRVKLGEIVGDITEMGLLVTRLRTVKNEDITIPNSHILTRETTNYSSSAKSPERLIIPITITIGYETNKDKVKELLLASSAACQDTLKDPAPFVLITSLDGSYISYELNVYINSASKILQVKSDIQEQILEEFHNAEIEILSPQYLTMRSDTAKL